MRRAVSAICLLAAFGCRTREEAAHATLVIDVAVDGDPRGLVVLDGDRELGRTDAKGQLRVEVEPGSTERVGVRCPDGQEAEPAPVVPVARAATRVLLACEPAVRVGVVAVSTGGLAGLPVRVDGLVVDETDSAGTALLRVERFDGEPFKVSVDASDRAAEPPDRSRSFRLVGGDELFVFHCEFTKPKRSRVARARRSARSKGPYELR